MRPALSIFALFLVATAAMAGPEFDRARRNTALARAALDSAERKLADVEGEEDRIRIEMDRIRDKQRDLDRKLDRLDALKRDLPGQIRDEEAKLNKFDDEIRLATDEVSKLRGPLRDAIDQLKAALVKVKELRANYVKQLEASDPYRHALFAAEAAAKNLAATQRAILERLRGTAPYQAASKNFNTAKTRLDQLKRDPAAETADRAAAASTMIQTESVVARLESEALASDESLTAARSDAARAEATLKGVLDQFERDLPKQEDMAMALSQHVAAQRTADQVDAALKRSEARVAAANGALLATKTRIVDFKNQQRLVDADIAAVQRDQDASSRDLDQLGRRLADVATLITRYRRDVDIADRRYRDARAYELVAARIDAQNEKGK